ncbi:helix-turn-helix transcriptional regulator [Petropleomorpha daqingensis]|uniref:Putative DNA-binding transcriptional regulator YafY n=1 Tax=Petropleomorpha daqingensis TaxID=2026353 RepID=A0A853CA77_9ACTN|nr:WYL domain-containing protein [Petropleomorpha daqingensis]NYJ04227.1 putative DNA-binding transcriptional regulator YafY [Petropleomorpha daqingensis]
MPRPTSRVLALLELLQSGGTRTVAELADRLQVDERTVRRYVGHLVDLDVPVESVRGRYGGYRLGRGYRLPPLMLGEDEALAVVLGLVSGRASGSLAPAGTAGETALAKIRRVLPRSLAARLDDVLGTVAVTGTGDSHPPPDGGVLLPLADAVRHRRPVAVGYSDRAGRRSDRVLHPHGIVVHAGRWYVAGADPAAGESRTLRLDRITSARTLPGSFDPPTPRDTAEDVVSRFATAGYRHEVTVHVDATLEHLRSRLPATLAVVTDSGTSAPDAAAQERWWRVEMRVEDLGWLPGVLAALDRPFSIERPARLRELVAALADRLAASAARPAAG